MAKSTSPRTASPRPMAARIPGVSAVVVAVVGSTVALAKALDQRPAAASTAARSPADGGADDPEAFKQLVDGGMDKAEAMAKAGLE